MKSTTKFIAAGALLAASSVPLVAAAAVNVDVVIGMPGYSTYVAPRPVYAYPPAVYYTPAPHAYFHHRDYWERRDYRHEERRHW